MRALNHPNIVRMLADLKGRDDDQYYIVLEKVEGGELFDRIVELEAYSEEKARATAVVLLDALRYLHGQGIAHRGKWQKLWSRNIALGAPQTCGRPLSLACARRFSRLLKSNVCATNNKHHARAWLSHPPQI